MRVLQILHDRERGGILTLAHMIEAGLAPRCGAFATDYLYPRPGLSVWSRLVCAFALARRIWRDRSDVLIAYQSTASILVGVVGWLRGCRLRVVHQTCTPRETPLPVRLMDRLVGGLGLYTANIANSAATWAEFARYPAAYRRSMILIEHGLDAPKPMHARELTRRRFNLPQDAPVLLNVGRPSPQKNQDLLIVALAKLPHVHLAIAGAGRKAQAYGDLADELGVADRVHLLGALPPAEVADLYGACDLFVFPSVWETFGLAAVEAAMVGMPMVVADLPALREVLRADGFEPVRFVKPNDTEGWVAAIRAALSSPPPATLIAPFSRSIGRKYSKQRMIESYQSLFDTVTPPHGTGAVGERSLPAEAERV
jgi:glycosyltransferase involved in cell wall biosynthesis